MTDTGPTPERRWRYKPQRFSPFDGAMLILDKEGDTRPILVQGDDAAGFVTDTLNEAEDLRADVETYRTALLTLSFCPECDAEPEGPADHKPDCRVGLAEEKRHGITRAGADGDERRG